MLSLRTIQAASTFTLLAIAAPAVAHDTTTTTVTGTSTATVVRDLRTLQREETELQEKLRIASDAVLDVASLLDEREETGRAADPYLKARMLALTNEIEDIYQERYKATTARIEAMRLAVRESLRLSKGQM